MQLDSIHIWQVDLSQLCHSNQMVKYLDPDEQQRAAQFIFDKHRQRYIAAHYALRTILQKYLTLTADKIIFETNQYGKPYITAMQNPTGLEFNLSHSCDTALIALRHQQPIGIDIEYFSDRDYLGIAKHSFSPTECAALTKLPANQLAGAFFHIWTQKEAFIKAIGQGLAYNLQSFSVTATPPAALLAATDADVKQWFMHSFTLAEAAAAAVATTRIVNQISYFKF